MAITIKNQPNSPNVSNTKLVYSVSSSNAGQPQFQYITDVYQYGTLLTRFYTYPNPNGNGIVELSNIMDDNLGYDYNWKQADLTQAGNMFQSFDIKFGEAYGSSVSSSIVNYPDLATASTYVFLGTVDPTEGSYDYQATGSIHLLSDMVTGSIANDKYVTVPIYSPGSADVGTTERLRVTFKDKNKNVLATQNSDIIPISYPRIVNIPIGKDSTRYNNEWILDWEYADITLNSSGEKLATYRRARPCNGEGVTFSWINKYGVFDYYTVTNPVTKATSLKRDSIVVPNVDYSSDISYYDIERRGETQYNVERKDVYKVTTDYIDSDTANFLSRIFESDEVYVQTDNGDFIPVNIQNKKYNWNTNQYRQKRFQYNIEYVYSNKRYDN